MAAQKISFHRKLLLLGAILGFLAILLGAYSSHGLKTLVSPENVAVFKTGVRFQMYHAFFALIVGSFGFISKRAKDLIFYFVLVGTILFSGSIYGLATDELTAFDFTTLGFLTPFGGLLLIFAWGFLIMNILKIRIK